MPRATITKSKSGHYTVSSRELDVKVRKIASLDKAQIVRAEVLRGERPSFGV